jgi:hypothetical protein
LSNLNKFLAGLIPLLSLSAAWAGEAVIFDHPSMIAYIENERVSGLYDSENDRFSCYFLFRQDGDQRGSFGREIAGYKPTRILTFITGDKSPRYEDRFKQYDRGGILYRNDDRWVIKMSPPQIGCGNAMGVFDSDPPDAEGYTVVDEVKAIGIKIVVSETRFYDFSRGQFVPRRGYLVANNNVIVLQTRDQFSLVRFVDPQTNVRSYGHVTTGWVHTSDLVDPFPPAKKP